MNPFNDCNLLTQLVCNLGQQSRIKSWRAFCRCFPIE